MPQHRSRVGRGLRVRLLALASSAAVLAGLGIGARIGWFYWHNHEVGHALIRQEQARLRSADRRARASTTAPCNPVAASGTPQGLVEARAIGLEAPVLDGVGSAQLDVAVGHNPASAWPGLTGTVVLSAHDVSWFSRIDHLQLGDTVSYLTPCRTFVYTVVSHQIVKVGAPVAATVQPRLVLVTCYPLNALWITSQRYLVTADLTSVESAGATTALPAATAGSIPTSLPAPVAAKVAGEVTTTAPLGPLTIDGNPAPAWQQSTEALNAAGSALSLYFGAVSMAEAWDAPGWAEAAPGVGIAAVAPLEGATIVATPGSVTPTLTVTGSTPTAAAVTSTVRLAGGGHPGEYSITMDAAVRNGILVITQWTMARR